MFLLWEHAVLSLFNYIVFVWLFLLVVLWLPLPDRPEERTLNMAGFRVRSETRSSAPAWLDAGRVTGGCIPAAAHGSGPGQRCAALGGLGQLRAPPTLCKNASPTSPLSLARWILPGTHRSHGPQAPSRCQQPPAPLRPSRPCGGAELVPHTCWPHGLPQGRGSPLPTGHAAFHLPLPPLLF